MPLLDSLFGARCFFGNVRRFLGVFSPWCFLLACPKDLELCPSLAADVENNSVANLFGSWRC